MSSVGFKQRRHDATAGILVDAAERVMVQNGADAVTMRDIAAEAGCATGTIYLYFKTKQAVINAITERHSTRLLERLDAIFARAAGPLETLRALNEDVVAYFTQNPGTIRLLRAGNRMELHAMPAALQKTVKRHWDDFMVRELELIRRAQAAGELRRDLSPDLIQKFIYLVIMGLRDDIANGIPPPEPPGALWAMIAGGIRPPSPQRTAAPR